MKANLPEGDRDFTPLTDEQLVVRAKAGSQKARDFLLVRCLDWLLPLIHKFAPGRLRGYHDIADAVDNAVFDILDAIEQYEPGPGRRCSFRTFAQQRVLSRLIDDLRCRHRLEGHYDHGVDYQIALDHHADQLHAGDAQQILAIHHGSDPAYTAARRELRQLLKLSFDQLHPKAWQLWQERCARTSLRCAAHALGLSHSATKRLWQDVKAVARAVLSTAMP